MSTGGPDLFVICKSCGSEVSPYITECPYCGNRLRKRAPKIDREGRVTEKRRRRPPAPSLPRLRPGEIPGIRPDSRPYATIVLVILGLAGCLVWRTALVDITQIGIIFQKPGSHWWRLITTTFVYRNTGYAFDSSVHFEVRVNGAVVNPIVFLGDQGVDLVKKTDNYALS